jgi:hypothetical protein
MKDEETRAAKGCLDPDKTEPVEVIPGAGIKVWVGIGVDGEIAAVKPGEEATCFDVISNDMTVDLLKKLGDASERKNVKIRNISFLSLSASPDDCWLYVNGQKFWVC